MTCFTFHFGEKWLIWSISETDFTLLFVLYHLFPVRLITSHFLFNSSPIHLLTVVLLSLCAVLSPASLDCTLPCGIFLRHLSFFLCYFLVVTLRWLLLSARSLYLLSPRLSVLTPPQHLYLGLPVAVLEDHAVKWCTEVSIKGLRRKKLFFSCVQRLKL